MPSLHKFCTFVREKLLQVRKRSEIFFFFFFFLLELVETLERQCCPCKDVLVCVVMYRAVIGPVT